MNPLTVCVPVSSWNQFLEPSLSGFRRWADVAVVGINHDETNAIECVADKLDVHYFPFERPSSDPTDNAALRNRLIDQLESTWLLWLNSVDEMTDSAIRRIREIVCVEPTHLPSAFALEIHRPGVDAHAGADAVIYDEIRLHQRSSAWRYRGRVYEALAVGPANGNSDSHSTAHGWLDVTITERGRSVNRMMHADAVRGVLAEELEQDPHNPLIQFRLGALHLEAGRAAEAAELLRQSINAEPRHPHVAKAYALLVHALTAQGECQHALVVSREAKRRFPDDAELLFREGIAWHQLSRLQEAIGCYRAAANGRRRRGLVEFPKQIVTYLANHNLALALSQSGQDERAIEVWRDVLEVAPLYRPAHAGYIEVLLKLDRTLDAMLHTQKMDKHRPLLGLGFIVKAQICTGQGDLASARRHLETGVRYAPHDIQTLRELFHFFAEHGPEEELLPVMQELARRDSDSAVTQYNVGTRLLMAGRFAEAVTPLEHAIELDPNYVLAHRNLADAYMLLGRKTEASQLLSRAESLSESAPQGGVSMMRLVGLGA